MKHLLTFFLFSTFATSAFATHAYRSENCVSTTHTLNYLGNYPFGGMYGMSLPNIENSEVSALPLNNDGEAQSTLEDAEVIFNSLDYKITSDSGEEEQCFFSHREWKSETVIEVSLISKQAAESLGLKAGDKITFICEETTDFPNGNNCEESDK